MSNVIPKTKRKDFEINEDGIIVKDFLWEAFTEVYTKEVDLRGFFKDFNETLQNNSVATFTDMLGTPLGKGKGDFFEQYAKKGEFPKPGPHHTRTSNMFETHHVWAKHDGFFEFETHWFAKCKTKYSSFGWVEFKLDLVCRKMEEIEIEGKKLIKGSWEFRNQLFYKNNYIIKYLHTIPFVRDSAWMQQMLIDHTYYQNLMRDIDFVDTKVREVIWNTIFKHFK